MVTAQQVRDLLSYDPVTGLFRWKVNRPPRGHAGLIAGFYRRDGYQIIGIDGKLYLAHRLVFLIETGQWPVEQVDHIDGNPSNNTRSNLREATHAQNLHNHSHCRNNRAKAKGVYKRADCNRWCAMIAHQCRTIYLGLYKTKDEAIAAYKAAAIKYHGEFAKF